MWTYRSGKCPLSLGQVEQEKYEDTCVAEREQSWSWVAFGVPSPTEWSTLNELERPLGHIRLWVGACMVDALGLLR